MARLIASIPLSGLAEIRVTVEDFRGKRYAGLRVWWRRREGEPFKPSRKGIVVNTELLEDIIDALQEIQGESRERRRRSP